MDGAGTVDISITLAFLMIYAGFEGAYLAWVTHCVPKSVCRNTGRAFALKIQLQATMQVVTRGTILLILTGAIDELMGVGMPGWPARVYWQVILFLAQLTLLYSISISWWRCLSLKRQGVDFTALFDGTFKQSRLAIPTARETVAIALERHVQRLMSKTTPRLSRMFYQANISTIRTEKDGQISYSLTWALLPIRVTIIVAAIDETATELCTRCELRGGIHRLEIFPSPMAVLSVMRYLQTNLIGPMASEMALSSAVRKQDELRHRAMETQLRILQAQIEPHFLFNTLANLRHLYRSSVDEGESMLDHLIVYLRCTLEELRSDISTVNREMDLVLHYLAIMKIRMGERLSYTFINSDDVGTMAFPPAMLISLVENAIMHGLTNKPDGKLTISAVREGQHLRVAVVDNGVGFSSVQGSGVGLSNIRQRLEVIHGNRAWLEVGALASGGFMASIVVPFSEKM
jgi:signal transduction histidine kinase